jgi:hypothetical protein
MTDDDRAEAILSVLDRAGTLAPFSGADRDFDLAAGYRTAARLAARRAAAGGRPVGRKIGFTNTAIWDEYGVHAPIWGPVWDNTVRLSGPAPFDLSGLAEPRIEPEIVLRLASTPEPGLDATALAGCVEAVALGFEVVQSPYPDWRFAAADAVAQGLGPHGPGLDPGRRCGRAGRGDPEAGRRRGRAVLILLGRIAERPVAVGDGRAGQGGDLDGPRRGGRRADPRRLAGPQRSRLHLDVDVRVPVLEQVREGQAHGAQADVGEQGGVTEHGDGHDRRLAPALRACGPHPRRPPKSLSTRHARMGGGEHGGNGACGTMTGVLLSRPVYGRLTGVLQCDG